MAIRRGALERVGTFDVTLEHGGDEQEWQDRLRAREPGARVLYVAGAAVDHRRTGADARLGALARGQHMRGPSRAAVRRTAWTGAFARPRAQDAGRLHVARRAPRVPGGADDGHAQRRARARDRTGACQRRRHCGGGRRQDSRTGEHEQWGERRQRGRGWRGRGLLVRHERDGRGCRRGAARRARWRRRGVGDREREAVAPEPRGASRAAAAQGARHRRGPPRARSVGGRHSRGAAALQARGRAAHVPAGRAGEVPEPQPPAGRASARRARLAAGRGR